MVEAVVAGTLVLAGGNAARLDLLRRRERLLGVTRLEKARGDVAVPVHPLGLAVWGVRP